MFSGSKDEIMIKTLSQSPILEAKLGFSVMGKCGIRTSLSFPVAEGGLFVCSGI